MLLIDYGSARHGDKPRGFGDGSVLPASLGLDDSLSVNAQFMSCNALERPEKVSDLDFLKAKDPSRLSKRQLGRAKRLEAEVAQMNHRYVDDGESSLYYFVVQLGLACSLDVRNPWEQIVVDPLIGDKARRWPSGDAFDGRLLAGLEMKDSPLTQAAELALEGVATCFRDAQHAIRKAGYVQPEELSAEERQAFQRAIQILDEYLLWDELAELHLQSSASVEAQTGAEVAAETEAGVQAGLPEAESHADSSARHSDPPLRRLTRSRMASGQEGDHVGGAKDRAA